MKLSTLLPVTAFLVLFHVEQIHAICEEKYLEAYAGATSESLVCEAFGGDPTIHAIVYGCKTANQNEDPPAGVIAQSFTQKCMADVGDETTFTCYELTADADYTAFTAAADPNLQCTAGEDEFETPIYHYHESTASYELGGELGSQKTAGEASTTFQPELALGAFYTVTVKAGEALETNPPETPMEEAGTGGGATNVTDAPFPDSETGDFGDEEIPEGPADDNSSSWSRFQGGRIYALLSMASVSIVGTFW